MRFEVALHSSFSVLDSHETLNCIASLTCAIIQFCNHFAEREAARARGSPIHTYSVCDQIPKVCALDCEIVATHPLEPEVPQTLLLYIWGRKEEMDQ